MLKQEWILLSERKPEPNQVIGFSRTSILGGPYGGGELIEHYGRRIWVSDGNQVIAAEYTEHDDWVFYDDCILIEDIKYWMDRYVPDPPNSDICNLLTADPNPEGESEREESE